MIFLINFSEHYASYYEFVLNLGYIDNIFNNEKVKKFLKKFLRYYVYFHKLELNSGYIDV